ncbi:thioredoxin [Membranihabitans marinus]|uniref:thioredoxin n=1 Tax=Membranihabitans marinus TaxID=1227546 RepID=UPI001EFF68D1|nr:thioredoxin [Membranihabitans marinus]
MAFELTDTNFQTEVLEKGGLTVIDFWAEWCGPCKMIGPIIEELATDYDGKALIGKVNVDHNPDLSIKYGIRSIPTILFVKDGEIVDKLVGATTKQVLAGKVEQHLS